MSENTSMTNNEVMVHDEAVFTSVNQYWFKLGKQRGEEEVCGAIKNILNRYWHNEESPHNPCIAPAVKALNDIHRVVNEGAG